jgi:uncharacterized membrane protein YqiK
VREAEIAREIALMQRERERLQEEARRLEVEGEREAASQAVVTVQEKAVAERAKEVGLIAARKEVELAEQRVEADERLARSRRVEGEADAYVRGRIREAENLIDPKVIYKELLAAVIEKSPQLVAELMAPAKSIESIRVLNVNGTGLAGAGGAEGGAAGVSGVLKAFLEAGAMLPVLREILAFSEPGGAQSLLRKLTEHLPGVGEALKGGGPLAAEGRRR